MDLTSAPATPLPAPPMAGPKRPRSARRALLGLAGGAGLALLLAGGVLSGWTGAHPFAPVPAAVEVPQGLATMPNAPIDGVLTLTIPRGASADQQAGGRGYAMPSVIDLDVGDTIVIHNADDAPHMILYTFLLPGQTDTRTFTAPGSEVYSSGCGLHAAAILNFTTIFVHDAAPAGVDA